MRRVGEAGRRVTRVKPRVGWSCAIGLLPVLATLALASPAMAETECASAPNPVVCENALPGDPPSNWQVQGVGDPTIQGFGTSMSVNAGQTISFKINTPASSYHIDILRLGYYKGNGARLIAPGIKPSVTLPQTQPECLKESSTGLIDCGDWKVSASWTVPSNAISGVYIAHLVRDDTGGESQIPFVVRNDASHSEILLQTSDATWEAYNDYGGNSLYTCTVACPAGSPKAYKGADAVSYNRPFDGAFATDSGASYLYYAEYQLIYWLEQNGYNVSYTSESEVNSNGALLKNHRAFISSGHDEYWSAGQRANVEAARESGVNLAFFSGNELFWKTRWEPSIDGSNTPNRTLVSYKETHYEGPVDPQDPPTWTGAWRDPRGGPTADGGHPENALSGQQFEVNSGTSDITVPGQFGKLRLWRKTAVATLPPSQTLTLSPGTGTLGYEWDEDVDNGSRPAGEFDLSATTVSGLQAFTDYASTLNTNATATHHLTVYREPSGALVFGAGTVQWSWGLANVDAWNEGNTDPSRNPPDPNMEQFTVNLLAEMGAQPGSLVQGIVPTERSTDKTPPSSTITSPAQGETFQDGSQATITGTATDTGGVVAGVEVSTDNGETWHPATLTTPAEQSVKWSYTWAVHDYPATTIKTRAVDDSANLETPSAGVQVHVSCPCSIWGQAVTPPVPDSGDSHSVEVGVKFTSETFGVVTGMRFYKSAANTGTHTGNLWSSGGTLLATATFTNESESGWQQVNFSNPVEILPHTTYVVSYFAPAGHYADSQFYFYTPAATGGNALNSPPLHALPAGGPPSGGTYFSANGVFSYSSVSAFPVNSFSGTNYWVDPVFEPAGAAGRVTNVSATAGNKAASVTWSAPSEGGPVTEYTITPYKGGTEAQTPTVITGTPPANNATIQGLTAGVSYTFTVQAANPSGAGPVSTASNSVTPTATSAPSAPTGVTASAATNQALVSWSEPASNGGSPITNYTITPYIGATAQTPTEVAVSVTSTILKGLVNGTNYTFTVTAKNAIGNSLPSSPSSAIVPRDTIFDFATPATIDSGDTHSVELGVKFSSEVAGTVTGIRFYKATTNTGTHTGSLWSSSGTLLATATFTTETASGWQQVNFSTPVAITPFTTYIAGYFAPKGRYSDTSSGFASLGASNPPLQALANPVSANGVYSYSSSSAFPTSTFKATNYWLDVDFAPTPPPGQPTNVTATAGQGSANVSWSAPSEGGPVSEYTITPYKGGTEAQTPTVITGNPPTTNTTIKELTAGATYTFKVQAANSTGAGPASAASNAVTPTVPPPGQVTNVTATAGRGSASVTWSAPSEGGPVTEYTITPYKGGTEAQTPTVITGTPPANNATIQGLTAGVSYTFTVQAANPSGAGPVSTASNSVTPTATSAPSAPTGVTASAATNQALVSWSEPASNGGSPITNYTITPYIGATAQTPTEVAVSVISTILKGLVNGTNYTFTVTAKNAIGNSLPSSPSSAIVPRDTIFDFATPATIDSGDTHSLELGVKFSSEVAGTVTGIRFYKATTNTGTHTGSLWSSSGTLLATATFTTETASGWQQVNFSTPVAITPFTTYIAGYFAPGGRYSSTPLAFEFTGMTNAPLQALDSPVSANGVYADSATSTFPTSTNEATNYWVDVDFEPTQPPGQPTNVTATAGQESANVNWSAPTEGGPVSEYTITPYKGGTEAQTPTVITGNPPTTNTTIKELTAGATYTFTVQATNPGGSGPVSAESNAVTPTAPPAPPGQPTNVTATAGQESANVNWSAPTEGGPVSEYTITPYKGGTEAQTPTVITGNPPTTNTTIKELTAGATYTFTVQATNPGGSGPVSAESNAVTPTAPPAPPGQPTNVTATAGQESANVNWSAPTEGGPVSEYTITPYKGGTEAQTPTVITGNPPTTNTTIKELTAGATYTFTVQAANSTGAGPASAASNAVTPTVPPPGQVTNATATAGQGSASVTWSAPSEGGPVTEYTITPYKGGTEAQTPTVITGTPPANSATIQGLTAGVSYTFTVQAANPSGAGPVSAASNAVTPTVPPPGQVTNVTATAGNKAASVSWSAPTEGGPVSEYTITPYKGGTEAQTPTVITGNPPTTNTTIKELTGGATYTFKVQAANSTGTGPVSVASNAVTPTAFNPPSAPTGVTAGAATGQALVSWTAPSSNGGSAITSCTIKPYIGASAQTPIEIGPSATSAIVKGLTNGVAYTFTVTCANVAGGGPPSSPSTAVTPEDTIFDFATPATIDSNDTHSVELGVKFRSEVAGKVTGIRFYKATTNTGTHIGSLWSLSGTLLASATFTNETASGWQQLNFSTPVTITANTTYVAGYFAPKGRYSDTSAAFASLGASNPPLSALANPISTDGVYSYSAASTFPSNTFNSTNYWVDVDFEPSH